MSDIERYIEIVKALDENGWYKVVTYINGEDTIEKYDNFDLDGAPVVFLSHNQIKDTFEISIVVPDLIEAKGELERTTVMRYRRKPTRIIVDSAEYHYYLDLEKGSLDIHYIKRRKNG